MSGADIGTIKQACVIRNDEAVAAVCYNRLLKTWHQRTPTQSSKSIAFRVTVSCWIAALIGDLQRSLYHFKPHRPCAYLFVQRLIFPEELL